MVKAARCDREECEFESHRLPHQYHDAKETSVTRKKKAITINSKNRIDDGSSSMFVIFMAGFRYHKTEKRSTQALARISLDDTLSRNSAAMGELVYPRSLSLRAERRAGSTPASSTPCVGRKFKLHSGRLANCSESIKFNKSCLTIEAQTSRVASL